MKVELKRHVAKAISYRFIGTIQTIVISYILTGSFAVASTVGIIELCIKPVVYFFHERIWYRWIKFGLKKE